MVFPVAEGLSTPFLTQRLSPATRSRLKEQYRLMKKYGIRTGFGMITGTGFWTVVQEAAKDGVKCHAKRYLGCIFINSGFTLLSAGVPLITNVTIIAKYAKACHSVCSAAWRATHNVAEAPLMVCDFLLFGEYVPSCGESDYDLFSKNTTDFICSFDPNS